MRIIRRAMGCSRGRKDELFQEGVFSMRRECKGTDVRGMNGRGMNGREEVFSGGAGWCLPGGSGE